MTLKREIEIFHLMFCRSALTSQDKNLIVLKGGCNLRFFFGSNRYSEDIDFDVEIISRETLRKRVDKLLASQPFHSLLAARKIAISNFSAPKQTDTVQRWKVSLRFGGVDLPTKIEFSRRGIDHSGVEVTQVEPLVLAPYNLTPLFMSHYTVTHAALQKIQALAGRAETQARDLYDLDLLLSKNRNLNVSVEPHLVVKAIESAMTIDVDQFRGQVVEFLEDDAREYYLPLKVFDDLQSRVIAQLESIKNAAK
jgi:predicted nucleotidyltransferase component of viral defense system